MTIVTRRPRNAYRGGTRTGAGQWTPPVDIVEREEGFTLTFDLPGFTREDIELHVRESILHVTGERPAPERTEGKYYRYYERPGGTFERTFRIPEHVDAGGIEAAYENGVLTLTLPRSAEAQPRTITIK
jgi:HSP20 family protein